MTKLSNSVFFPAFAYAPEGEGAGGNEPPVSPGSVLFPDDAPPKAGETPAEDKKGDTPVDDKSAAKEVPAEWKEYTVDPAKTDAENEAAKAEHDKTKPAAKDGDNKDDDPLNRVPEDGKYELTMPDGVEVDQELLDALGPKFSGLKLTTAQAQEVADEFTKVMQERATKEAEGWATTITKWADDAKADKEIGGANWDASVAASQRAINKLGTPALKEYLNASGGGNHPEVIRFVTKVGAMIKEDAPPSGGAGGSGNPVDVAHSLFPTDAPKGK